jgi:hypothetical protein
MLMHVKESAVKSDNGRGFRFGLGSIKSSATGSVADAFMNQQQVYDHVSLIMIIKVSAS